MKRVLRLAGAVLLWMVVTLCLTVTVVPHFLDRIYYRGPASAHFDGQHFFNPDGDDDRLRLTGANSRWTLLTRQIFGDPTRPAWPDHVAVTPTRPPARVMGAAMLATWVGHATLLVQADGVNILTDPVWSETVGPFGIGPRRVAEPGIGLKDLPKIDVILVSHNHYDHMDVATLKKLWDRDRPLIVTSLGNDAILRSAGIEAKVADWGGTIPAGPIAAVHVTRNHHWGSRWFTDRNRALWSSFVVRLPHGNFFFSGDTGIGDGKWPAEAAAYGPIRLAAIPIGAFRFEEGQMGAGSHIGPWDAIRVWNGLGRPFAIPIHWGTFRLSREGYRTPPTMLERMLRCAGEYPGVFADIAIGKPVTVPPLKGWAQPRPDMAGIDYCNKLGEFRDLR
ncbi:MBL fold metallo-hydrolase [Sphingomonas caeni]|uniref:MBL fold metallo-hydrolase n=1 Tax=Sphingomonas caeni TaxID=2984949 RepID=UPI003873BEF2